MPMYIAMYRPDRAPVVAVLGPTNTGKTHLAIERLCGHSSGIMGFPLRLLAREVYDRVVRLKGANQVALVTGEEKIVPPDARYFLCTAESMPVDREAAFVALDEAQLGADPERGHVFTDRLLRARGREETMILGADTLRPVLRQLVPDAEVTARPRFSTLSYAGAKKLSRLPPRSAIVAFSAEEVYAVAEMLRRMRGGAAVVMGALSPRTRNAQVAMYQSGEVDYLVATDAIGMGLNMDVNHVAFASLRKFDGRRLRRLTVPEMAQIAGRAGRHQRDGSFGTLGSEGDDSAQFAPEEIEAIEGHRFAAIDQLYWRDGKPDLTSIDALIASLERRPNSPVLRAAPEAVDLAVLKRLAEEGWVRERARGQSAVRRLWAAAGLPDFQKSGPEHHARLVSRLYRHLSEGTSHVPQHWIADELARLDNVGGDIATLSQRIAATRTWAYVAHRPDWLAAPAEMAERARELETKLSDALHQSLMQRFVDRRTAVLMRDLGSRGIDALPVRIGDDGTVTVDDEPIGRLDGFRFRPDPAARHADTKMLLAAAERRLGGVLAARARALAAAPDEAFTLATDPDLPAAILWGGELIARLGRGRTMLRPKLTLHRSLDALAAGDRQAVQARVERWIEERPAALLATLVRLDVAARDPATPPGLRALLAALVDAGGAVSRTDVAASLDALGRDERRVLGRLGVKIGALDLFAPALLKPEALRWRAALAATYGGGVVPPMPAGGVPIVPTPPDPAVAAAWARAGYRPLGAQMLRVDMAERIARFVHDARVRGEAVLPDPALVTSLGLQPDALNRLMRLFGFEAPRGEEPGWRFRRRTPPRPAARPIDPGHAFARLAELAGRG